jgi:hypothetical protein
MSYPVVDVTDWPWTRDEQMGSKAKLWVRDDVGNRWLFKERRHDHGEDWAEKISAELASLLGIQHVEIELATRAGRPGVISKSFLIDHDAYQLEHGNALLFKADATYPVAGPNFKTTEHTIDRALAVLGQDFITLGVFIGRPAGITTVPDQFVGYLMLDALVGNTDRHHENWAVIIDQRTQQAELAPLYDTASCLGRERTDDDRVRRLSGKPGVPTFEAYWRKMPSRWYRDPDDRRPLHPLDAFGLAAQRYPGAAAILLDRLPLLTDPAIAEMANNVPAMRISVPARQFMVKMLLFGRDKLISGASVK